MRGLMGSPATCMNTGVRVNGGSGTLSTTGATRMTRPSKLGGGRFENQPYWADGLFHLAFILDDDRLKEIARTFVDRCLAGQASDGYIGGWPEKPYSNEGDLYTQSLLFKALISYHRATSDPRIVPAMQRAPRHIKKNCPPVVDNAVSPAWRGGSYGWPAASHVIRAILWVYSKTGDPELMELAQAVYRAGQTHPGAIPRFRSADF